MPRATLSPTCSPSARRASWLRRWQRRSELPLLLLSLVWVVLFVIDEVRGLGPVLTRVGDVIWVVFIVQFGVELAVAPNKRDFLRHNWLAAISLALPALRVFRVLRILRFTRALGWLRGVRFVRALGTFNRGMRALGRTMHRRGTAYVIALTVIVTLIGAAGMFAFERESADSGIRSFTDALWWTAMVMTTLGSEFWPKTGGGRVLCLLLSLYAFAVFGYITAMLASFFVDRDAKQATSEPQDLVALREEIAMLREAITREPRG